MTAKPQMAASKTFWSDFHPAHIWLAATVGALILFIWGLPQPITMISASLRSETMRLSVRNPDENIINLPLAMIGSNDACRKDVAITPAPGSSVTYTREIGGQLVISVSGKASWGNDQRLLGRQGEQGLQYFYVSPANKRCGYDGVLRLPVAGDVTIGTPAEPSGGQKGLPLLSGDMHIYGRSVETLLWGILPLNIFETFSPLEPGKLFSAFEQPLPPGSYIGRAFNRSRDGKLEVARWWGFTDVDLTTAGAGERGMDIEAATNASQLEIYAPTPKVSHAAGSKPYGLDPDIISLNLQARLAGDPNLRWCFALLTAIAAVAGLALQLGQLPSANKGKKT